MHGQSLMISAIYLSISYYYEIKQNPQPGCITVSLSLKARMVQTKQNLLLKFKPVSQDRKDKKIIVFCSE